MTSVALNHVGAIDLLDLSIIGEFHGRNFLPYPFMFTRPAEFASAEEASYYANSVPDRFRYGDLLKFHDCAATYAEADIRVECHVQYIPSDTPSVRCVAYRRGDLGFVATQRPDADVVDAYTVSPYKLGAAICDFVSFDQPGRRSSIVVPEFVPQGHAEFDDGDYIVRDVMDSPTDVIVPQTEVSVYSTIQSHWRPTRQWGPDRSKATIVWIRVRDDGDYIYEPEYACARPMTESILEQRIDQLISDDVAILREFRRE